MLPELLLCRHKVSSTQWPTWRVIPILLTGHEGTHTKSVAEAELEPIYMIPSSTKQFSGAEADRRVVFSGQEQKTEENKDIVVIFSLC